MSFYAFLFRFFFNDTATTEIYTLSLHDALPISDGRVLVSGIVGDPQLQRLPAHAALCVDLVHGELRGTERSEEHTSELQSLTNLVCRLLLEKKKNIKNKHQTEKT